MHKILTDLQQRKDAICEVYKIESVYEMDIWEGSENICNL
jgi:hypothetical protein